MTFIHTLKEIREGSLTSLLDEEWTDLIQQVMEHGRGGKLQLTLTVKPNGDAVTIGSDIKCTKPKPGVGDSIFYADDHGNLLRRNPKQMDVEDEIARQRRLREAADQELKA